MCYEVRERYRNIVGPPSNELPPHLGQLNITYGLTRRRQWLNYRVVSSQGHRSTQIQADDQQQD